MLRRIQRWAALSLGMGAQMARGDAVALGDGEAAVVDLRRGLAVEGEPAQLGEGQRRWPRRASAGVSRGGSSFSAARSSALGLVEAVEVGLVVPEDALAEVDDVGGAVGLPRLFLEPAALGGLLLEALLVGGQLRLAHLVGLLPLQHEAPLAELLLDVGVDARRPAPMARQRSKRRVQSGW